MNFKLNRLIITVSILLLTISFFTSCGGNVKPKEIQLIDSFRFSDSKKIGRILPLTYNGRRSLCVQLVEDYNSVYKIIDLESFKEVYECKSKAPYGFQMVNTYPDHLLLSNFDGSFVAMSVLDGSYKEYDLNSFGITDRTLAFFPDINENEKFILATIKPTFQTLSMPRNTKEEFVKRYKEYCRDEMLVRFNYDGIDITLKDSVLPHFEYNILRGDYGLISPYYQIEALDKDKYILCHPHSDTIYFSSKSKESSIQITSNFVKFEQPLISYNQYLSMNNGDYKKLASEYEMKPHINYMRYDEKNNIIGIIASSDQEISKLYAICSDIEGNMIGETTVDSKNLRKYFIVDGKLYFIYKTKSNEGTEYRIDVYSVVDA